MFTKYLNKQIRRAAPFCSRCSWSVYSVVTNRTESYFGFCSRVHRWLIEMSAFLCFALNFLPLVRAHIVTEFQWLSLLGMKDQTNPIHCPLLWAWLQFRAGLVWTFHSKITRSKKNLFHGTEIKYKYKWFKYYYYYFCSLNFIMFLNYYFKGLIKEKHKRYVVLLLSILMHRLGTQVNEQSLCGKKKKKCRVLSSWYISIQLWYQFSAFNGADLMMI